MLSLADGWIRPNPASRPMNAVFYIVAIALLIFGSIMWQGVVGQDAVQRQVRRYAAQQGWTLLIVDSFAGPRFGAGRRTYYAVRFRDRDGTLVEGVIVPQAFGEFRLTKEHRIPPEVERGMFDRNIALDCRKCGTTVPPGTELCPYCHSPSDILTIR